MLKAFGYKLPGYFMEYGPVCALDEEDARVMIRQRMGVKRLPWGLQIWDIAQRPLIRWRAAEAS